MLIAPSLLSCDFSKFGEEIMRADKEGADIMHLDIMDGHFVPNLTFGPPIIKKLRKYTKKPFDAHLMISDPLRYAEDFAKAGADIISFHIEAESDTEKTLKKLKELNVKPAIAVKPNTPVEEVFPYLERLYMVLIMTVEPGFGGQSFMVDMMPKVRKLKEEITKRNLNVHIQVDGGIAVDTIKTAYDSGADIFVAGTAVFGFEDIRKAMEDLRNQCI